MIEITLLILTTLFGFNPILMIIFFISIIFHQSFLSFAAYIIGITINYQINKRKEK